MGGMLWGMGQALLEGTHYGHQPRPVGQCEPGDYLLPVNADAPDIDVGSSGGRQRCGPARRQGWSERSDRLGSAAAIANAVYHATGYRVRELPIAVEHLLEHQAPRISVAPAVGVSR